MFNLRTGLVALTAAALALTACGTPAEEAEPTTDPTAATTAAEETAPADETAPAEDAAGTVEIEDNNGTHTIAVPPVSVVALDNRTFETLYDWGIELSAASRSLMPATNGYKNDESIPDIGNHREPQLELITVADPDLIINGQRLTGFFDDIAKLAPNATQIVLDAQEGELLTDALKRQTNVLGQIFGKEAEAQALSDDLDAAIEAAKAAYDPSQTVMAVNVSGGNIGYLAPTVGRALGPVYDILDLTPSLEISDATDDHQGDDISVEAIAASNPDWILVMDRDAAVTTDDTYVPANEVLEGSAALQNVTAIKEGNVVYMPADTYTNEGIQTYTEFFQTLADAFAGN